MDTNWMDEDNNAGQRDGSLDNEGGDFSGDLIGGLLTFGMLVPTVHFNPPAEPDRRERYIAGYDNARRR